MKNLLMTAVLILSTATMVCAADASEVSYQIRQKFLSEYSNASQVNWTITKDYSKAEFLLDNQKMQVFYTPGGEVIGSSSNVEVTQLPVVIKRAYAKKFGKYAITEAIHFQSPEESVYYISATDGSQTIITKISENGACSMFKRMKV